MAKRESLIAILILIAFLFVIFHTFSSLAQARNQSFKTYNSSKTCNCCITDFPSQKELSLPPSNAYFKVNIL